MKNLIRIVIKATYSTTSILCSLVFISLLLSISSTPVYSGEIIISSGNTNLDKTRNGIQLINIAKPN